MGNSKGAKSGNFRLLTEAKVLPTPTAHPPVPVDAEWGIDTVNLSFLVNPDLCESDTSLWSSESSRFWSDSQRINSQVEWNFETDFATVKVILFVAQERCNLRFNAARLLSPKSRNLLHPKALMVLVSKLLVDIRSHVWPVFDRVATTGEIIRDIDWGKQIRITRLDVARNFFVDDLPAVKAALLQAKPKYGKTSHLYWDSKGGWTLSNETSRSGKDRIYDKSAELANNEAGESLSESHSYLRFEAQLQKERLATNGLTTLEDISDTRVWLAIRSRWDACRWGVEIPVQEEFRGLTANLNPDEIFGIAAVLKLNEIGLRALVKQSTYRKYLKLAQIHGLNASGAVVDSTSNYRFLSLDEGRLMDRN